VLAAQQSDGNFLAKLEESPFYAEGGGQVADSGVVRANGSELPVLDVYRVGEDQALLLKGQVEPGTRVEAEVDHVARFATMRNHTATHLLHAALRDRLGTHVRQAGSAVQPDKLRFDFTHGAALSPEERDEIEDRVNHWVKESHPVRALQMSREDAEQLGAMALFGEKYGDWVRVVEVEDVSRELCGGTHLTNTAGIGIFKIVSEGSSAANVRRIEALTGPAAIDWFRDRARELEEAGRALGSAQDPVGAARRAAGRIKKLEKSEGGDEDLSKEAEGLAAAAHEVDGITVLAGRGPTADQRALLDLADRIKSKAGDAAVVLGGTEDGKVALVASFSEGVVKRGLSAVEVIREAAQVVGGGGGGRENVAQAGGRDPDKLDEALAAARGAIERKLSG
jgi:alanyl-tRNA synthetase